MKNKIAIGIIAAAILIILPIIYFKNKSIVLPAPENMAPASPSAATSPLINQPAEPERVKNQTPALPKEIFIPVNSAASPPSPVKKTEVITPEPPPTNQPAAEPPAAPLLNNCVKEGETISNREVCCADLRKIFVGYYSPDRSCEELSEKSVADKIIYYVCSNCGNKTCESWENRCTCPQDCIYP